jgi:hypothetical protein
MTSEGHYDEIKTLDELIKKEGDKLCWPLLAAKILGVTRTRIHELKTQHRLKQAKPPIGWNPSRSLYYLRDILDLWHQREAYIKADKPGIQPNLIPAEEVIKLVQKAFEVKSRRIFKPKH